MSRRRRVLIAVGVIVTLLGGGAWIAQGWAHRHARTFSAPGDPVDVSCARCHGPDAPVQVAANARPTPFDLAVSPDGRRAFVVCPPQHRVLVVDLGDLEVVGEIRPGGTPGSVAVSPDGARVAVTVVDTHEVVVADAGSGKVRARHATGTEPHGVAFDATGTRLFVANAGSDDVSVLDLAGRVPAVRRPAGHEPYAVARSPDGATVAVVSRRSDLGPMDVPPATEVTLLDGETGVVRRRVRLPSCHMAEAVAFSADGARVLVPAIEARNLVPILQVDRGWVMAGVIASVDVATGAVALLPLTEPMRGFADPAGLALSADGRRALVLSGGTDEVALLDAEALRAAEGEAAPDAPRRLTLALRYVRGRAPLRSNPRAIARAGDRFVVTERLADAIAVLDADGKVVARLELDRSPPDALRRGEQVFHDARAAFQGHFACRSCHPGAHTDGLTYDFEIDGVGRDVVLNRSLRGVSGTEPFKWVGTNATLDRQCGPRFAMVLSRADVFDETSLRNLVGWLHSLPPPPPRPGAGRVEGVDAGARERGKKLFERAVRRDGRPIPPSGRCTTCHMLPHGTTGQRADVGTKGPRDGTGLFDIPHLTGIATKAPYLHDARATTLEEIWTMPGVLDQHGVVTDLSKADLNDLIEYLRGL